MSFIWVSLALGACATSPVGPAIDPAVRQARLAELDEFSFTGALGIWTDEQSMSGRIQWQQSGKNLAVKLTGPFGIGEMALTDSPRYASFSRSGNVVSSGDSVDEVLQAGLGLAVPVPVQQLKSWVRGLPGDGRSVVTDELGRLSSLRFTDGQGTRWSARVLRYTTLDGLDVPGLILASGGKYSVRLLLKNWKASVHFAVQEEKPPNTRLVIPSR
ncbi:MAG: lipoprotein insertase outer membrane protein LolB [Granulosicoccus sp.]